LTTSVLSEQNRSYI